MNIYHILMTKYQRLFTNDYQLSTKYYVRNYKLFMQNKPNSPNVQINLNNFIIMTYMIFISLTVRKTKPIQTQFKAKQSQFWPITGGSKAKTNPIQTQTKPIPPAISVPATLMIDDCLHPAYNENDNF